MPTPLARATRRPSALRFRFIPVSRCPRLRIAIALRTFDIQFPELQSFENAVSGVQQFLLIADDEYES
jgi:hypothetical protein